MALWTMRPADGIGELPGKTEKRFTRVNRISSLVLVRLRQSLFEKLYNVDLHRRGDMTLGALREELASTD